MLKRISCLTMVLMLLFSFAVFAAPQTLPNEISSTTWGILTVTNPSETFLTSYDKVHNISGYASNGVNISLYYKTGNGYSLLYRNGAPISFTVGASGMFVQPVSLGYGKNSLVIRAELNGQVQYVLITVTVLSSNILNLINGFSLF